MQPLKTVVVLALAGVLAAALPAFAKPNFSGEWKMNADKSDFGPAPRPDKLSRKITHEDPNLQMTTSQSGPQGEITTELKYTTDGKESTNTIRGAEVKGSAKWDGDNLVIDSKREIQGQAMTLKETWVAGEDGKTLTITTAISGGFGEFTLKLVLEKQ